MKKLLTILFTLLIVKTSFCQINTQFLANPSTKLQIRGDAIADSGFIINNFADTATASLGTYIKTIPGILMRTGDIFWMRNSTANRWLQLLSSGYYSFSNLLTESPAGTVKFGGTSTANTIANLSGFRLALDSGNVVITSKSTGSDTALAVRRNGFDYFKVNTNTDVTSMIDINVQNGAIISNSTPLLALNATPLVLFGSTLSQIIGNQIPVRIKKQFPFSILPNDLIVSNDTLNAKGQDSTTYFPFAVKFTSFVDNLERDKFTINGAGKMTLSAINTAGGTTGDQTINEPTGTVNFAAAASTITVTDRLCTTSSIVFVVIRTNDATARIANVVPGSGSFVIHLTAAATAETSVGFLVIN